MQKINHYIKTIGQKFTKITLTTPAAIIIGAVIISGGLMGYGAITTNGTSGGGEGTQAVANPLPKMLKALGVNKKAFAACVETGAMAQNVLDSKLDGDQAGVNGTPSTFVIKEENGVQYVIASISGAQEYQTFKTAIDQALSTASVKNLPKFKGKPINPKETDSEEILSKVYLLEYSDIECPFCIRLYPTIKQLRAEYAGKISFAYRNFPLPPQMHPHAQKEAEMISCVGSIAGMKAYYSFIDAIFDFKIKNNIGYIPVDAK